MEEKPAEEQPKHKHNYDTLYDDKGLLCGDCLINKRGTFRKEEPKPKHAGGRPCKYCENKEHYLKIATDYINKCKTGEKPKMPFVEELAMLMDIDDGTLVIWAKKIKADEEDIEDEPRLEHPEINAVYSMLKTTQKLRLKQRALGRYNAAGPLALLRFDHGAIDTSKQILTGDKSEPLQIEFINERPIPDNE